jgi:predicted enzyme related to lactoylglutathione lyase
VTWFEIIGKDSAGLQKFYRDVFGWKMTAPVKEMGNYSMLEGHEPGIGGGLGEGDARVSIYVEVDDPQKFLDKAVAGGGRVIMPVETITPTTTIAIFTDPAGNMTGLMKANPRPAAQSTRAASSTRSSRPRAKATAKRKTSAKKTTRRTTSARKRTKRR